MEGLKRNWEEIKRVFSNLEDRTKVILIGMTIFTLFISVLMFKVFDNPMLDGWRDNKETEQILKERDKRLEEEDKRREDRKTKKEVEEEEVGESKEPTF